MLGILLQAVVFAYWNILGENLLNFLRSIAMQNIAIGGDLPMLYFYMQQSTFWISFFILSAIATFLAMVVYFAYANYAKGLTAKEALSMALKKLRHAAALVVVLFSIQIMLFGINTIFMNITPTIALLISLILWIVIFYAFIRFSLIIPILALERRRVKKGLQKAWELSKGNTLKIVGIFLAFLLVMVCVYAVGDFLEWFYAITGLEFYLGNINLVMEVTDALLNTIHIGFLPIALTNLYLNLSK